MGRDIKRRYSGKNREEETEKERRRWKDKLLRTRDRGSRG
jgi:hypothetical protein